VVADRAFVADYLARFKDFPPRQKPAKFNVDDAVKTLESASGN
jgi:arylsulfatase